MEAMWFPEDVARMLASVEETMNRTLGAVPPLDDAAAEAFRRGFDDALQGIAVAFGVRRPGRSSGGSWSARSSNHSRLVRIRGVSAADLLPHPTDIQRWW